MFQRFMAIVIASCCMLGFVSLPNVSHRPQAAAVEEVAPALPRTEPKVEPPLVAEIAPAGKFDMLKLMTEKGRIIEESYTDLEAKLASMIKIHVLPGVEQEWVRMPALENVSDQLADLSRQFGWHRFPVKIIIYPNAAKPKVGGFVLDGGRSEGEQEIVVYLNVRFLNKSAAARHELAHTLFKKIRGPSLAPVALDEGLAYFVEAQIDKKSLDHYLNLLDKEGPLTKAECFTLKSTYELEKSGKYEQAVATGCGTVYWLAMVQGIPLSEIARMEPKELPQLTKAHLREIAFMRAFLKEFAETPGGRAFGGVEDQELAAAGPVLPVLASSRALNPLAIQESGRLYARYLGAHGKVKRWDKANVRNLSGTIERKLWEAHIRERYFEMLVAVGFEQVSYSPKLFSKADWEVLQQFGPLTLEQLVTLPERPLTADEETLRSERLRATGWAFVYCLSMLDGTPLSVHRDYVSRERSACQALLPQLVTRIKVSLEKK